jgi:hypothetical protein
MILLGWYRRIHDRKRRVSMVSHLIVLTNQQLDVVDFSIILDLELITKASLGQRWGVDRAN